MDFPSKDIIVTALKKDLRFATARPKFILHRGVPRRLFGELKFRLRVHLARLQKLGQVVIEPLDPADAAKIRTQLVALRRSEEAAGRDPRSAVRALWEQLAVPSSTITAPVVPSETKTAKTETGSDPVEVTEKKPAKKKASKKKATKKAAKAEPVVEPEPVADPVVEPVTDDAEPEDDLFAALDADDADV